jgi:N-acetylmuramoyl-L-alanine amidase
MGSLVLLLWARPTSPGAQRSSACACGRRRTTRASPSSPTQALAARHSLFADRTRLVIDIDGLELSPQLRDLVGKVRSDDPFIAGVRVGQNQPRVVRLVIDLKQTVAPQQLTLAPVAPYQHRLVFDLYPTQARDPLLALINEREPPPDRPSAAWTTRWVPSSPASSSLHRCRPNPHRARCGRHRHRWWLQQHR